jgi:excisionase family DNA binding protein
MPNDDAIPPLLVDRREAARLLGICERTIDTLAKRRELSSVRIGRRVLFPLNGLHRYIESNKTVLASGELAAARLADTRVGESKNFQSGPKESIK